MDFIHTNFIVVFTTTANNEKDLIPHDIQDTTHMTKFKGTLKLITEKSNEFMIANIFAHYGDLHCIIYGSESLNKHVRIMRPYQRQIICYKKFDNENETKAELEIELAIGLRKIRNSDGTGCDWYANVYKEFSTEPFATIEIGRLHGYYMALE